MISLDSNEYSSLEKTEGILDTREKVEALFDRLYDFTKDSLVEADRKSMACWARARYMVLD